MKYLEHTTFTVLLTSIITCSIYLLTLAPGVNFIDAGELATVAYRLGIAHPTGYPLFTILGRLFSLMPFASVIWRLNFSAAVFCAIGAGGLVLLIREVLHWLGEEDDKRINTIAMITALLIAFSKTFWSQATSVEVYPLHLLLLPLVILLFLRLLRLGNDRDAAGFAFILGVTFTNHMTTILLAPACLLLYFVAFGADNRSRRRLFFMTPFFVAGLSIYLFTFIRAHASPIPNWGDPETLTNFIRHWTAKQYRVWIFSSSAAAAKHFSDFWKTFPVEYGYVALIGIFYGVIEIWRSSTRLALFFSLLFVTTVFYAIGYDIHDIETYFLAAYIAGGVFFGAGLVSLWKKKKEFALGAGILSVVAVLVCNWEECDESKNHLVTDFTMSIFHDLPHNAVVISSMWDFWVSASEYYQLVEEVRPDVTVIDPELLRRSWYLKQLEQYAPEIMRRSASEVAAFKVELAKFEEDIPYNPTTIQFRYEEMIESFIHNVEPARPVYVSYEVPQTIGKKLLRVPEGLVFRLAPTDSLREIPVPAYTFHPFDRVNYYSAKIPESYALMIGSRAAYLAQHGRTDEAKAWVEYGLSFAPAFLRRQKNFSAEVQACAQQFARLAQMKEVLEKRK